MNTETQPMTPNGALEALQGFVSLGQIRAMIAGCRGEEGEHFRAKLNEFGRRVQSMPKTYEQDGKGAQAVAHLHYLVGGCDWYITERDLDHDGAGQVQAFGLVDLGMGPELGYINLVEVIQAGGELDLYFEPKTLAELGYARMFEGI